MKKSLVHSLIRHFHDHCNLKLQLHISSLVLAVFHPLFTGTFVIFLLSNCLHTQHGQDQYNSALT